MPSDTLHPHLEAILKTKLKGEVRFDAFSRVLYSTDASNYKIEPVGVVIPRTVEDVLTTVETAANHGVAILPRGGGTSLAGQAVGQALVIDFSKYLNRVLELNTETKTVRVEPGIYLEQLNRQLKSHDLMFGPDPATARVATMGGVIGNNATGSHSILYGMAGDNLDAAQVILSNGNMIQLGPLDETALSEKARRNSTEGRLYKGLLQLRGRYGEIIERDFPKHWRRASGYSLPYLVKRPFNSARILAGSEGTLAVATEVTLNLVPRPSHKGLTLLQFADLVAAMEAVPVILEKCPSAVELIDRMLIDLTREHPGFSPLLSFVEGTPEAILAVEFYGQTEKEVEQKTHELVSHLNVKNIKCYSMYALSPESQADLWGVRRAGLGILMSKRDEHKPIPCIEDVSVPVDHLSKYVRDVMDIIKQLGTKAAFYGHASAGCLHVRPLVNLKTGQGITLMKELEEEAFKLAVRYGGVMSGEHGDGLQRSYLNEKLFGPTLYQAMRELKAVFDPDGMFNPGKIVDSRLPDQNLRHNESSKAWEISTYLDWSRDKGFIQAVEMCNGQGICRKLGEGIMCPSYMATRDEMDTTRARANALREVLSGDLTRESLTSDEMYRVYDLCLQCKGCKSECPSGVDVAKMKVEFLAHYHFSHGITMRDRMFGYIHGISRLSSLAPRLANPIFDNPFSRWVLGRLGIHPNRSLPRLTSEPFTNWFYNRQRSQGKTTSGQAVYFHDTWASFYYPEVGQAAVKLLEANGLEVILVPNRVCCGRPMLSKGMVDQTRSRARKNVELLAPYARRGIPVIGTEPSCILTFRDEYPDLLPDNSEAQILAENSFLLEEFFIKLNKEGRLNIPWQTSGASVFFHAHCHQRALAGGESSIGLLSLSGCSVEESRAGCCGMAGSFGYEKEHYEISRIIGEDRLFPAIRKAEPETLIAVSGISCRQQIEHFTGRQARHVAEVLADQIARTIA